MVDGRRLELPTSALRTHAPDRDQHAPPARLSPSPLACVLAHVLAERLRKMQEAAQALSTECVTL
jgi:hypothetical protein